MHIKNLISNNWFKIVVVIFLVSIAVIVSNYLAAKTDLANREYYARENSEKREFDAQQKEACLTIYKQESTKWNNVTGWRYDAPGEACYIQYKNDVKKTHAQCEEEYSGEDGELDFDFFREYILCLDNLFEKSF